MTSVSLPAERVLLAIGLASAALIVAVLGFQYLGGIKPCEMCQWQRWPHFGAILVGLLVTPLWKTGLRVPLVIIAALIAAAALIAVGNWGIVKGQIPELLSIAIFAMLAVVIAIFVFSVWTESMQALALAAILLVALSGLIGLYQTGMQIGWLPGPPACTIEGGPYVLGSNVVPEVSCTAVTWSLFGLSLAAYNAIASFLIAGLGATMLAKRR